jgi:hypothetical protein
MDMLRNLLWVAQKDPISMVMLVIFGTGAYYAAKATWKMEKAARAHKRSLNYNFLRSRTNIIQDPIHKIRYAARLRRSA